MQNTYIILLLVRIVLPAAILVAIALRPFGLTLVYLVLFLILPIPLAPDEKTFSGSRGKFLLVPFSLAVILLLVHIAWHSLLAIYAPYGTMLKRHPFIGRIGHNLGLVSYLNTDLTMAFHYLAPELVVAFTSLLVYMMAKRFLVDGDTKRKLPKRDNTHQAFPLLTSAGKYLCLFLMMFSGILMPNVVSAIYFLVFMGAATMWALGRTLEKGFAVVSRCIMAIMAVHVMTLVLYQCNWVTEFYPPHKSLARYFGLVKIVHINVTVPHKFLYEAAESGSWVTLANPLLILFTYYALAIESRELFKPRPKKKPLTGVEGGGPNGSLIRGVSIHRASRRATRDKWRHVTMKSQVTIPYIDTKARRGTTSETTPLIRTASSAKAWTSTKADTVLRKMQQDSIGSFIMGDEDSAPDTEATMCDEIIAAIIDFFQVIIRSSYIPTTITMMAWSIMYHSWLTFVLLMWANIVWLCHDQRSFMLKTSPILVVYAMILLLVEYVYGMRLTEDELPSKLEDFNLRQIGVGRTTGEPFIPLLIKSLFTCMFWITLRQRIQDIRTRKQDATLADIAVPDTPLERTVSTAASVPKEEEKQSRLLRIAGEFLRKACARYWIYVVVIMLFVIGITGERMTIFRIIYMFLFLSFILMFQISWYLWRRLMYMFWIVVIIYAMISLILIYVYQFDNFSKMIEKYLYINESLQHDLGLEPYDPADLFLKLLTPTCFLILTIMQVHYFHKDFMILSDPKSKTYSKKDGESGKFSQGASTMKDDIPQLPLEGSRPGSAKDDHHSDTEPTGEISSVTEANRESKTVRPSPLHAKSHSNAPASSRQSIGFRTWLYQQYTRCYKRINNAIDNIFVYLDLHLIKIIFIGLMLLCVCDVCALHMPIMVFICPALLLKRKRQRHCVLIISSLISLYFMAKMVYQIDYIKHYSFEVNCTKDMHGHEMGSENETAPNVLNNAEWVGFVKATPEKPLAVILKGYIGLIAIFTFYSLVGYRQQAFRQHNHQSPKRQRLMFPNITRKNADKDLNNCAKYLLNYGFYKFGVEITLICMMGVIGSRMDAYAVIYAIWLLTFVAIKRKHLAKLWAPFTAFVTIVVPIQYSIALGFLPQFCVTYPWNGSDPQMKHVRMWLFLPDPTDPPHAVKLIFDYFLLMFATLQLQVFRIEKTYGDDYAGGSNSEDTGKDWETLNFVNPVPDFLGIAGTWLDVLKKMVFLGMLWVTLAIMFMTGTNRVNLFSMGYLIGSFIFLWQGTDFYLLPKEAILQWWSWLLRYNVTVVVLKTLLQILGCLFGSIMENQACWLVQLLGIGCVDKFAGGSLNQFIKMEYVKGEVCSVPQEDIGLAWDGVCFAFLILQRRLFHSYYFYRVIDDSKATTVLASRGAELIEELRQKQMLLQEEQEINILKNIKIKMEKIKANQRKIQGNLLKEPASHDIEEDEDDTQHVSEHVPLVRGDSGGFHTPDSPASPRGFHTPLSEPSAPPSPARTPPPVDPLPTVLPAPAPSSHGGPPSPSSALMTASLSLDAYLEPRRISFESPPSSDLLPRAQSPEESYPVFSPPPIRRRHTVASPSLLQRTSIISQSSRSEPKSHHTYSVSDSGPSTSAAGIRRRVFTQRHEARECPPYRPPASHQQAIRSGDYYMFDDLEEVEIPVEAPDRRESDIEAPKQMGIGKLLSTVIKTDLKHALHLRRASMPAVRTAAKPSISSQARSYTNELRSPRRALADRDLHPSEPPELRGSVTSEDELPPDQETCFDTVRRYLDTVWVFISSFLVSITRQLMKYSRDYRYVSHMLTLEKKVLKEKEGFGIGLREASQMRWEPIPETIMIRRKLSEISVPEIRILAPSMERGLDATPAQSRAQSHSRSSSPSLSNDDTSEHESAFSLQTTGSKDVSVLLEQDDLALKQGRPILLHIIYATWYAILAHTEIVCYIMVFINQIQSATILSIPLPLMVFLWGTLTIPRPTKTFWVTMIAYTEVIVLIKSMFQFEILPWNQKVIPENMPFTAPRIIGIERKQNYALYDLLLLLIIFLHRYMLKSLGLWKESQPDIELREDIEFPLEPEDTQKLVEGRGIEVGQKYVKLHERTGPRHRLVDRLRHVQATITAAMRELDTTRSDPRVIHLVHQRLQHLRALARRHRRAKMAKNRLTGARRSSQEPLLDKAFSSQDRGPDADSISSDLQMQSLQENELPGTSKDDDHYKVNDDQEPIIAVSTTIEKVSSKWPRLICLSLKRYLRPTKEFFIRMQAPGARVTADVYAYMFLCDFTNFLVVIFGFAAFGTHQGDGGVQTYLEENKVPIPFLVMLILQFALIVIDRALYLRKFILGKILFQFVLIIGVHIWMFFILPFITERTFNSLPPPPIWYMVKSIYLLLSAYQIRCGYPHRIIGNFLCRSYYFLNMVAFRGFMAVPFVFELRTLMDWVWTDTSMTLLDWLKMEDIFANIFLLKCSRYIETEYPLERGVKKSNWSKYLLGGGVLAFVIAIIWFPLVFFAFGSTVGFSNPPSDVTVKIRIGPFLPVYQMSAQSHNIILFSERDYVQLNNMYGRDRSAQTFLSNYLWNDVAVVKINPNSTMMWEISPPELDRLEDESASNSTLTVKFTFVITHPSNTAQNPPTIEDSREVELPAFLHGKRNPERETLFNMLTNKTDADTWLNVKKLFPKFLKIFNKGTAKPAQYLSPELDDMGHKLSNEERLYRDVQLRLERDHNSMYWRVREACPKKTKILRPNVDQLADIPMNNCDMLVMYTFNDRLFPETLNFISGGGIIGLYTTFVFLASRVIRTFFTGIYTKIMFDDLPNVDRVLQLCLDIYLVREALELALEEDLFAKLVFLYRSPETMIKWTRMKEDQNEEEQQALPPSR